MGAVTAALATMAVASSVTQAAGQYKSGRDAAYAEKYNANVLREQAGFIQQSADLEKRQIAIQGKRIAGEQVAGYSKGGVTLSGSPLQVMIASAANNEMDQMIVQYNADVQRRRILSEAAYKEQLAKNYARAGKMQAGSTLLTGLTNAAMNYGGLTDKLGGTGTGRTFYQEPAGSSGGAGTRIGTTSGAGYRKGF